MIERSGGGFFLSGGNLIPYGICYGFLTFCPLPLTID